MSRNLIDEKYVSHGGIVPLKWMPPEVGTAKRHSLLLFKRPTYRPLTTINTPLPVMCGALGVSCTRYGVWDIDHSQIFPMLRYMLKMKHTSVMSCSYDCFGTGTEHYREGPPSSSTSWNIQRALQDHDSVLVSYPRKRKMP